MPTISIEESRWDVRSRPCATQAAQESVKPSILEKLPPKPALNLEGTMSVWHCNDQEPVRTQFLHKEREEIVICWDVFKHLRAYDNVEPSVLNRFKRNAFENGTKATSRRLFLRKCDGLWIDVDTPHLTYASSEGDGEPDACPTTHVEDLQLPALGVPVLFDLRRNKLQPFSEPIRCVANHSF